MLQSQHKDINKTQKRYEHTKTKHQTNKQTNKKEYDNNNTSWVFDVQVTVHRDKFL